MQRHGGQRPIGIVARDRQRAAVVGDGIGREHQRQRARVTWQQREARAGHGEHCKVTGHSR